MLLEFDVGACDYFRKMLLEWKSLVYEKAEVCGRAFQGAGGHQD